jgi:hypothetical protein
MLLDQSPFDPIPRFDARHLTDLRERIRLGLANETFPLADRDASCGPAPARGLCLLCYQSVEKGGAQALESRVHVRCYTIWLDESEVVRPRQVSPAG